MVSSETPGKSAENAALNLHRHRLYHLGRKFLMMRLQQVLSDYRHFHVGLGFPRQAQIQCLITGYTQTRQFIDVAEECIEFNVFNQIHLSAECELMFGIFTGFGFLSQR